MFHFFLCFLSFYRKTSSSFVAATLDDNSASNRYFPLLSAIANKTIPLNERARGACKHIFPRSTTNRLLKVVEINGRACPTTTPCTDRWVRMPRMCVCVRVYVYIHYSFSRLARNSAVADQNVELSVLQISFTAKHGSLAVAGTAKLASAFL